MLLRSLFSGVRAATGSGLSAAASRAGTLALPATAATSAAAASSTPAAATLRRGLATLCSSLSSLGSLAVTHCSAQLGSTASRTVLGSGSSGSMWSAAAAAGACGRSCAAPHQLLQQRTASSHLKVKFAGGKIKSYSSYKSRFRVTGTGKVLYARPGHVHKRFSKSKRQLFDLSQYQTLTPRYAKTVKKLGFKLRKF